MPILDHGLRISTLSTNRDRVFTYLRRWLLLVWITVGFQLIVSGNSLSGVARAMTVLQANQSLEENEYKETDHGLEEKAKNAYLV